MKTLILIRHATADNEKISQPDSDRNLNELGQLQAKSIAEQLQQKNCLPDYLLCSPANRTRQTATILCQTLKLNPDALLSIDEILYSGSLEQILSTLCDLTIASERLFVIGHNPNLSWLAHRLCSASNTITLPPAGVIGLEFAIKSWQELSKAQGRLLFFLEPNHESS
jgi:phosphohistidine phosphatase